MQSAEIGYFELAIDGNVFELKPTLRNMAKIADSKYILEMYDSIHNNFKPDWLRLSVAHSVLKACCDNPAIEKFLVRVNNMKPCLNSRCISMNDQILVAAALLRHGIAGVNRPKNANSGKSKGKKITEFDVNKIVADAMIHFGLSEDEALNLTMSKFYFLLAAKYPPESASKDVPSLEAHKAAMKAAMEANK